MEPSIIAEVAFNLVSKTPKPRTLEQKAVMELGIIVGCVWGALPVAIGLFPQKSSISTSK